MAISTIPPADGEQVTVVVTTVRPGKAWDTAAQFALAGHVVVAGAPRAAAAEHAAEGLRARGAAVFGAQLDLTDIASVDMFSKTASWLAGPIDIMIHDTDASAGHLGGGTGGTDPRLGAHHLAAQLIRSRAHEDLLVVRFGGEAGTEVPRFASTSVFEAALREWTALRREEAFDPATERSLLDRWEHNDIRPDHAPWPHEAADHHLRLTAALVGSPGRA
ncbi:SDR family NAD(P)-dependent oxidoreductase [Nocardia sp. alder85J]|uniref:SDR family NAD(P)-dependent oxidoreductase n=1 Tax=Nocardia sp. alder85J TaxID=2862949 RepID=UPI001CD4A1FE|nr:SDR family NAD(P)-dependent oxidoreductase [Nocardia sp. alder85J]MCX4096767.1 hypothetical protein [Nocardia sp. alder85J]